MNADSTGTYGETWSFQGGLDVCLNRTYSRLLRPVIDGGKDSDVIAARRWDKRAWPA